MEGYPTHYISHNLPLVVLSGLGTPDPTSFDEVEHQYPALQQRGFRVTSDLSDVTGSTAEELLNCFLDFDARHAAWNNRPGNGKMGGTMGFTFRSVGRSLTLPPHKAVPPEASVLLENSGDSRSSLTPTLHSPISPLSPASPIFPDGLMTPLWFTKHQLLLPSIIICFFNLTLDEGKSTLSDNKLKNEINAVRSSITSSGYKTRVAVVLVTEDEDGNDENNLQDRLANIRRATSLDPKSLYCVSRSATLVELHAFVGTVLAALQPVCIEYYRDLSKHARRKRNRGVIPPPTAPPTSGTSQTLSTQGWNVRYETKMGFFAEFRQEMDAACRNYEAAYEALFDGEVLEGIAGWSPRFEDARLLADILAIRILRCLLWSNQTSSAVMSWSNHRMRTQELVDRKGKGTSNYGWEAWESRWSQVMSELIGKVDLPVFQVSATTDEDADQRLSIWSPPEKSYANEVRLLPWHRLHHQGYWMSRSAKHLQHRRRLAHEIPEENRKAPGDSPASAIASRAQMYDTYLCHEPHDEYGEEESRRVDHTSLIIASLEEASQHFSSRRQIRASERLLVDTAYEYTLAGRWQEALDFLEPTWRSLSWRSSGWWPMVAKATQIVKDCALHTQNYSLLIEAEWELLCNIFTSDESHGFFEVSKSIQLDTHPHINAEYSHMAPTLEVSFAFQRSKGNVGIVEYGQLTVISNARASSPALELSTILLSFNGGVKDITLNHVDEMKPSALSSQHSNVEIYDSVAANSVLHEESGSTALDSNRREHEYSANLHIAPSHRKVFLMKVMPREAGEVTAIKATVSIAAPGFTFDLNVPLSGENKSMSWWEHEQGKSTQKRIMSEHPMNITILPKPPKLEVTTPNLRQVYYLRENIQIPIHMTNNEDDSAVVKLAVSLSGASESTPTLHWTSEGSSDTKIENEGSDSVAGPLGERQLGDISSQDQRTEGISFRAPNDPAEYILVIRADYYLRSDPETPLTKQMKEKIVFIGPFEANYNYDALVNPEPWPSYFYCNQLDADGTSSGLKQSWMLNAQIVSFGIEPLIIEGVALQVTESKTGSKCNVHPRGPIEPKPIIPKELINQSFDFDIQKDNLEDRRVAVTGFSLEILWHRESNPESSTYSTLLVPPLSVPFSEPRVLASAQSSSSGPPIITLTYTIENPSSHFLTFSLTMETNEDFAFSGAKMVTTQLVPLSKHEIKYNLLPIRQGIWIRPVLRIIDTVFKQELKPIPANGCKADKNGFLVWVDVQD